MSSKKPNAEDLSEVFVEVTDDLSYSRTFYRNRSVRVYLNQLAQNIFGGVYKRQPFSWRSVYTFFTEEVPEIVYVHRRELFISLLVFLLAATIGVISSVNDPDFASSILSSQYTQMTDQNIANNDPMAVYRTGTAFESFWAIFWNNIRIDLIVYSFGIFFAIGSLFILLFNGVMVGAFQYYFVGSGFLLQSVLTIWLHGTIEISTIVLSGGAGLITGKGLLFPGTYSRMEGFRHSATMGFKLFVAIIPFTLIAAIIEAYVTRQTGAPSWFKGLFILVTLAIVVLYFIILPYLKCHGKELHYTKRKKDQIYRRSKVELFKIKALGEIVGDTFLSMRKHIGAWGLFSLLAAISMLVVQVLVRTKAAPLIEGTDRYSLLFTNYLGVSQIMDLDEFPFFILWPITITVGITIMMFRNQTTWGEAVSFRLWFSKHVWNLLLSAALLTLIFYPVGSWMIQFAMYQFLFLPMMLAVRSIEPGGMKSITYSQFWDEIFSGFIVKVVRQFFFLFLSFALIAFLGSDYFISLINYILVTFPMTPETKVQIGSGVQLLVVYFALFFSFGYWLQGVILMYFSQLEQNRAIQLKKQLDDAFA